ncbi:hypothetical protein [Bartonella taylorii]|uniref:Yip1 domain-containing protein n=1 Tax=Bartonella taylorii TaxID=33046 RepID=A0A9Q8Z0T2_BARTA|nr:hypothetical protein [Bartonella taylorii]USP03365.1 hypothetical protein LAJ60_02725 [Bartonella taylorii]
MITETLCSIGACIAVVLIMLFNAVLVIKKAGKKGKEIVAYCIVLFTPTFVPWLPVAMIYNYIESDLLEKVIMISLVISFVNFVFLCVTINSMREDGLPDNIKDIALFTFGIPLLICGFIGGIIALFMWNITIGIIILGLLILIGIKEHLGAIFGIIGVILGVILMIALIKFIWRIV